MTLLSAVQQLEGELSGAICYGLGPFDESLAAAQQRFLRTLGADLAQCLNGPVVLAGISLRTLAVELAENQVEAQWLVPDYYAGLLPISSHNADLAVGKGPAGLASLDTDFCETLVVEGTVPYLEQLALLTEAKRVLTANGELLLFGEYLDDDSRIERSELANLSSLRQLSKRLGFQLLEERDYSEAGLASVRALEQRADALQAQILSNTEIDHAALESAASELRFIAAEFKEGRRALRIFKFRKDEESLGEYANAEFGDIDSFASAELNRLFEESFSTEFDQEQWQWKYQHGNGRCVVARAEPGGNIVSHYGGAPREILYFGQSNVAIQVCDVMVLPEIRRHYGKRSLFFKTAATFLEREIGNTVRQLLGFGFPNQRAMNIALRLGLYEKTDDFLELVFPVLENPVSALQVEVANLEDQEHSDAINSLWQQMAPAFGDAIIGVRDASYLKYRYFEHPFYQRGLYHPHLVRDETGQACAFFVLKAHGDELLLMDLICPAADIKPMLGEIADFCRKQEQGKALKIWITKAWQEVVQLPDCVVNDLGIEIPCNSWNRGPDAKTLYGAWWLTAGDMDFM